MSGRLNPALDPLREQIRLRFDANPFSRPKDVADELADLFPELTFGAIRMHAQAIRRQLAEERRRESDESPTATGVYPETAPDVPAVPVAAPGVATAHPIPDDDADALTVAPCVSDDARIVERIAGDVARAALINTPPVHPIESDDTAVAGLERELHRTQAKLAELQGRHRAFVAASSDSLAIAEAIRETVVPLPAARPRIIRNARKRPRTAVILAGDWHATETVWPDGVRGINRYDMDTCARRAWLLAEKQRAWLEDVSHQWDIDRCVVALLGDMNSGNIHDELAETNEVDVGRGVVWTGALLGEYLWYLGERTRLKVVAVPGNHGRLSLKPKAKVPTESLDWIAYAIARERLRDMARDGWVSWDLGSTWVETFTAQRRLFVVTHGQQVRGQMGIPFYGFRRLVAELMKTQQAVDNRTLAMHREIETIGLYRVIVGHFHQSARLPDAILNGTLKGTDEYSVASSMAPVDASQTAFLVDPAWGVCGEEQFDVNDAPDPHGFTLPDVAHREAA